MDDTSLFNIMLVVILGCVAYYWLANQADVDPMNESDKEIVTEELHKTDTKEEEECPACNHEDEPESNTVQKNDVQPSVAPISGNGFENFSQF